MLFSHICLQTLDFMFYELTARKFSFIPSDGDDLRRKLAGASAHQGSDGVGAAGLRGQSRGPPGGPIRRGSADRQSKLT